MMDEDEELRQLRAQMRERIAELRGIVNRLVDAYGVVYVTRGGQDADALASFANRLVENTELSRDEFAAILAFTVRRLWTRRGVAVRPSVN